MAGVEYPLKGHECIVLHSERGGNDERIFTVSHSCRVTSHGRCGVIESNGINKAGMSDLGSKI